MERDRSKLRALLRLLVCVFAFVLPLKFGSLVGGGEMANFPMDVWEWLFFICWPAYLAPIASGVLLFAAALVYPRPRRSSSVIVPLMWLLPVTAGIVGLLSSTEVDYADQWILHFAGLAAFCASVWWVAVNDGKMMPWLLNALALAGLWACVLGWRQHFGGLADNFAYSMYSAADNGVELSGTMLQKMQQVRIYGNMVDPNVYASLLLLTCPLTLLALRNWGRRFEYPRIGSVVLVLAGLALFTGALYWSGSRGGAIGAVYGVAVACWAHPFVRGWRLRWTLPAAALVLALIFAFFAFRHSRDGFASASARLGYYKVALRLFMEEPLTGVGLGEFFPNYLRSKPMHAEVTRDAHSMFFSFLSQTGAWGGFVAFLLLVFPLLLATLRRGGGLFVASLAGTGAFMLHSQLQFNALVPGVVYLAGIGCLFAFEYPGSASEHSPYWRYPAMVLAIFCCIMVFRLPGEIQFQRAETAERSQDGNALAMYEAASLKMLRSPAPLRELYRINASAGKWEKARECAERMVLLCPHRASFYLRGANAYMACGDMDKAKDALDRAEKWYPYDPTLFVMRALYAFRQSAHLDFMANRMLSEAMLGFHGDLLEEKSGLVLTYSDRALLPFLEKTTEIAPNGRKIAFRYVGKD